MMDWLTVSAVMAFLYASVAAALGVMARHFIAHARRSGASWRTLWRLFRGGDDGSGPTTPGAFLGLALVFGLIALDLLVFVAALLFPSQHYIVALHIITLAPLALYIWRFVVIAELDLIDQYLREREREWNRSRRVLAKINQLEAMMKEQAAE